MGKCARLAAAAMLAMLSATAVRAAPPPLPAALEACTSIREDSARLKCFDREMAAVADRSGGKVPAPSAAAEDDSSKTAAAPAAPLSPEQKFGLSTEGIRKVEGKQGIETPRVAALTARIASVSYGRAGRRAFTLDNGQVWRQAEDRSSFEAAAGSAVTITPGALGSYWLSTSKHNWTRVERIP